MVSLTFDDTRADEYQVGAMVAARQMRATFYVNSTRIGNDGYMTAEQLGSLASDGNEIAGHTLAHQHLTELDSTQAQREICDDRVALLAHGFTVTTFAYPFGNESGAIERMAKMCGYNAARDSGGLAFASCPACPAVETLPPADRYQIRTIGPITSTTTLEQLEQAVTNAERAGGGWVPIVFHHVCDGCATNAISPATLTAFLDWLADRKAMGTGVKTVAEVMGGDAAAGVPGPTPGTSENRVINASLEHDLDGDAIPDCWQQRQSGTSEAAYALTQNAYQGQVAQNLTVTSYSDGTRRFMTRQECALPAQPGHSYRISAWYMADVAPRYGVYYRTAAGTWKSLEQSPELAPSAGYVQAAHTTAPLPDDATGISVGLSVHAVGSITMDAFQVVDALAPVDAVPPSIAVTGPAEGAPVSSTVTIAAASSDDIARVDFRVNDRLVDWVESPPFETTWDTTGLRRGTYAITARAFDRSGNVATSAPVTVNVGGAR